MTDEPITVERRPRTYLLLAAATLVVAAVAVGAYAYTRRVVTPTPISAAAVGSAPARLSIHGNLRVDSLVSRGWTIGANCAGGGGYADIQAGAPITITDPAGKVVAVGRLGDGSVNATPELDGSKTCIFPFRVEAPAGLRIYGIEVTHRGRLPYPEADLVDSVEVKLS